MTRAASRHTLLGTPAVATAAALATLASSSFTVQAMPSAVDRAAHSPVVSTRPLERAGVPGQTEVAPAPAAAAPTHVALLGLGMIVVGMMRSRRTR